jgi:hypothetical protein
LWLQLLPWWWICRDYYIWYSSNNSNSSAIAVDHFLLLKLLLCGRDDSRLVVIGSGLFLGSVHCTGGLLGLVLLLLLLGMLIQWRCAGTTAVILGVAGSRRGRNDC